jgi:hypothetical protein
MEAFVGCGQDIKMESKYREIIELAAHFVSFYKAVYLILFIKLNQKLAQIHNKHVQ